MSKKNVLLLIFFVRLIGCMELEEERHIFLEEELCQNVIKPYLDLQKIGRISRTCKIHNKFFNPATIQHQAEGFPEARADCYRSTYALSRFALYNNSLVFAYFYGFDAEGKDASLAKLEANLAKNDSGRMEAYRKYYGTLEEVDKRIIDQLKDAIIGYDQFTVRDIIAHKKYNIFNLFEDTNTLMNAFSNLCFEYSDEPHKLLSLLPVEDQQYTNRTIECLCKYDRPDVLCAWLQQGYLSYDQEYGHGCTLLHYAALNNCKDLIEELKKRGADVKKQNVWGRTAQYYADAMYRIRWRLSIMATQEEIDWFNRTCSRAVNYIYCFIKKNSNSSTAVLKKSTLKRSKTSYF